MSVKSVPFHDNNNNKIPKHLFANNFVPQDMDVIMGRGKKFYNHRGNKMIRYIVASKLEKYNASPSKKEKSDILSLIVKQVRRMNGYFLKKDPTTGLWFDVGDIMAREKISQLFRDAFRHNNRRNNNKCCNYRSNSSNGYNINKQQQQPQRFSQTTRVSHSTIQNRQGEFLLALPKEEQSNKGKIQCRREGLFSTDLTNFNLESSFPRSDPMDTKERQCNHHLKPQKDFKRKNDFGENFNTLDDESSVVTSENFDVIKELACALPPWLLEDDNPFEPVPVSQALGGDLPWEENIYCNVECITSHQDDYEYNHNN